MSRRHQPRRVECPTGKVAYQSQGRAFKALARIAQGAAQGVAVDDGDPPCAAYRCGQCGQWHLTRSTGGTSVLPPADVVPRREAA